MSLVNMKNCSLFLDGEEVAVTDVQIEYSPDSGIQVEVQGIVTNFNNRKEESVMDRCEKACDEGVYPSVLHEYSKLGLKADEKLLQKYDITTKAGELTYSGRDFVIAVLFNENKAKIVEVLREIEKAKAAEKKK